VKEQQEAEEWSKGVRRRFPPTCGRAKWLTLSFDCCSIGSTYRLRERHRRKARRKLPKLLAVRPFSSSLSFLPFPFLPPFHSDLPFFFNSEETRTRPSPRRRRSLDAYQAQGRPQSWCEEACAGDSFVQSWWWVGQRERGRYYELQRFGNRTSPLSPPSFPLPVRSVKDSDR
jgi:hypothetical protein